jgi:phospholipase/carboxylesterase
VRPELAWAHLAPTVAWLDALPYPPERVVLGGWSQGAMVAYALGLAAGRPRPAAVLALGGAPPVLFAELDLSIPLPRIVIAHGSADDVVPVAAARNARTLLEDAGAELLYRETSVGHELDRAVIPDLRALLAELPGPRRG